MASSEYEVVTTNLQTRTRHADQAYELSPAPLLPMNAFYQRHVSESPLQHPDWEAFRDPDEMIYRVYTRVQDQQEQYVDGLLGLLADNQMRDSERSRRWSAALVTFSLENEANAAVLKGWIETWMPLARRAVEAYCGALPEQDDAAAAALGAVAAFHRSLGLDA